MKRIGLLGYGCATSAPEPTAIAPATMTAKFCMLFFFRVNDVMRTVVPVAAMALTARLSDETTEATHSLILTLSHFGIEDRFEMPPADASHGSAPILARHRHRR